MKHFALSCGFVLSTLFVSAPALHAQSLPMKEREKLPLNVEPLPTTIAPIDPAARDLVARTMNRYRTLKSFESLITRTSKYDGTAGNPTSETKFVRIQLGTEGRFVVGSLSPALLWRKEIYDGKNLIKFSYSAGKRYTLDELHFPLGTPRERRVEAAINAEGPLVWFLTGSQPFTALFLSPLLTRFDMAPDGNLQKVTIEASYKLDTEAIGEVGVAQTPSQIELWIDPKTLTLDHARVVNNTTLGEFTDSETYSQTRFNPQFDDKMFRVAAPAGYVRQKSWID